MTVLDVYMCTYNDQIVELVYKDVCDGQLHRLFKGTTKDIDQKYLDMFVETIFTLKQVKDVLFVKVEND